MISSPVTRLWLMVVGGLLFGTVLGGRKEANEASKSKTDAKTDASPDEAAGLQPPGERHGMGEPRDSRYWMSGTRTTRQTGWPGQAFIDVFTKNSSGHTILIAGAKVDRMDGMLNIQETHLTHDTNDKPLNLSSIMTDVFEFAEMRLKDLRTIRVDRTPWNAPLFASMRRNLRLRDDGDVQIPLQNRKTDTASTIAWKRLIASPFYEHARDLGKRAHKIPDQFRVETYHWVWEGASKRVDNLIMELKDCKIGFKDVWKSACQDWV